MTSKSVCKTTICPSGGFRAVAIPGPGGASPLLKNNLPPPSLTKSDQFFVLAGIIFTELLRKRATLSPWAPGGPAPEPPLASGS